MMNLVGLCFIFTSIITAAVLSPTPNNQNPEVIHVPKQDHSDQNQNTEVIHVAKPGLSVNIVVQNEEGGTKISISTPQQQQQQTEAVEEKGPRNTQYHQAKEVICDAFGTCRHKISGVFGRAKENVVEVEEEVKEAVETLGGHVAGKTKEGLETVKDATDAVKYKAKDGAKGAKSAVQDKAKGGLETLKDAKDTVRDKAKEGLETVETGVDKAKHIVQDKAKGGLETLKDAKDTVRDKAKEGLETVETGVYKAKHIAQDKAKGGLEKAEKVKEKAKEGQVTVETEADKVKHLAQDNCKLTGGNGLICRIRNMVSSSVGSLLGVIHLLGFATAYGMSVWVTFVSSYVLAEALPRQQFGMVQSKIYPVYFRAMAYSIAVALFGHVLSGRRNMSVNAADIFQGYSLISSLLMVFANLFYLEPRATEVMHERMKVEKEEGRGRGRGDEVIVGKDALDGTPGSELQYRNRTGDDAGSRKREIGGLNERLKKLNSMSSMLNILTLASLTWHLVYLGQRLHMTACP